MANWEANRRLDYIEDRLIEDGRVNRSTVIHYFGISAPQATVDFARYCEQNPRVAYNPVMKCYSWIDGTKAPVIVRGSTPARRKVWAMFKANGNG
jgi:hypothetical protein